MKDKKPYVTLAQPGNTQHNYHDRDSLPFNVQYPLIEFKQEFIEVGASEDLLQQQLVSNYWYQKANSLERQKILSRVKHINDNLAIVLEFIDKRYSHLGFSLLHISLAGSYAHSNEPGDIDFDVILDGSYFDYVTFNEGIEILDLTDSVSKISLTVMGMDNVLGTHFTSDTIHNDGFVHHDTIIREMLVAPMRNITVYGKPFDRKKNIDGKNVLVRVARQLYFAELTLEGKIPYYSEEPIKTRKAIKRIREAHQIIEWLLNQTS